MNLIPCRDFNNSKICNWKWPPICSKNIDRCSQGRFKAIFCPHAHAYAVILYTKYPPWSNFLNFCVGKFFYRWGEFLDHDLTLTAQSRGFKNSVFKCCNVPKDERHPDCLPIPIPSDDPLFNGTQNCMEFVRSSPTPRPACSLGPREQLNQVCKPILLSSYDSLISYLLNSQSKFLKHFIKFLDPFPAHVLAWWKRDLWFHWAEHESLTTHAWGKLKYHHVPNRKPLLPKLPYPKEGDCAVSSPRLFCFNAGDVRVNSHPGIATMHTIWLRQHNIIADKLAFLNPQWSDVSWPVFFLINTRNAKFSFSGNHFSRNEEDSHCSNAAYNLPWIFTTCPWTERCQGWSLKKLKLLW